MGESEDSKEDVPYFYDLSKAQSLDEPFSTENLQDDGIFAPES